MLKIYNLNRLLKNINKIINKNVNKILTIQFINKSTKFFIKCIAFIKKNANNKKNDNDNFKNNKNKQLFDKKIKMIFKNNFINNLNNLLKN